MLPKSVLSLDLWVRFIRSDSSAMNRFLINPFKGLINLLKNNIDIKSKLYPFTTFSSCARSVRFLQHLYPFDVLPTVFVSLGFLLRQAAVMMHG